MKAIAKSHFLKIFILVIISFESSHIIAQCPSETIISFTSGSTFTSSVAISLGQSFTTLTGANPRQLQQVTVFSRARFGFGTTEDRIVTIYEGEGLDGNLIHSETFNFRWPSNNQGESLTFPVDFPLTNGPNLNPGTVYSFYITDLGDGTKYNTSNPYNQGLLIGQNGDPASTVDLDFEIITSLEITVPTITESATTLTSSSASTYQWIKYGIDINGATAQSLDVSNQEGSYQVRITDSNGCEGISEVLTVDNKVPVFTSVNATTVQEGTTGIIYSASATDFSEPIAYSLANGINDNALFSITGTAISFISPPVFNEGGNNTYTLTVTATDDAINFSILDVTVTVFRPLFPPNGSCGTVLNFDGTGDYIDLGNFSIGLDGGSELTISYYFKGTNLQSPIRIQSDDFLVAGWTGNGSIADPLHILSWDGGISGILVGNVNDGIWHHVAMTWEQGATGGFRSYLDGVLVDSRDAANVSIPVLSNDVVNLGSFQGFSEYIGGSLDEVSIWDRALTQQEIQDLTDSGILGNELNLIHYYDFNEGLGSTLTDITGSLNGTLTNMDNSDWTDLDGNAITLGGQAITHFNDITRNYGDPDFELTAVSDAGTEGQGFTITYESSNESVATVSGKTVSIVSVGTTTITATQAGGLINGVCHEFVSTTRTLTVDKADQTISFNTLGTKTFGDPTFDLTATGGASGNPVTFTSSDETVVTISGNTVTIVGAGSATITASQAGDANYNAATAVDQLLTVSKADQIITFNPLAAATFSDADFVLSATGGASGNAVTYSSSDENVATISGITVTIVGAGSTTITASQLGNDNYNPAAAVYQLLTVSKADQIITFSPLTAVTFGDADFVLSATGGASGNAVTYSSSDESVATISGSTVTIVGAGTTTITASQAGNANYNAAAGVDQVLIINTAPLTVAANDLTITYGDDPSGSLSVTYLGFVNGDDPSDLTGMLTFGGITDTDASATPYSDVIIPSGLSSSNYSITYQNADLTINKASQVIIFGPLAQQNLALIGSIQLSATGGASGEPIMYTSSDESVVKMDDFYAEFEDVGTATISASQAGNENYEAATPVAQDLTIIELYIWNGTHWNSGSGPGINKIVLINDDYTTSVNGILNEINHLEVNTGVTLTVDNESTLEVNGDLTNDGTIIVESGSSLLTYTGNAITGNDITIKRNTRYPDGKYSFVGTPVEQNANITGTNLGSYVYSYDETQGYGSDDGLSRWIDASSQELIPGRGYTQASQQEIAFIGLPNDGTIIHTGTYTEDTDDANEGWNLVSNPYPAAINVSSFLTTNANIEGAVYLWDDNGSETSRGSNADYIVANGTVATNTTPAGGQTRYNQHLGSAQGFFVKLKDNSDTEITFTETMRVGDSNADANFFRQSTPSYVRINLTNKAGLFKQAVVGWLEDISDTELDRRFDAKVFNTTASDALYTLKANEALAIQGVREREEIPLGIHVSETGHYTLNLELDSYRGQDLYLLDKESGEEINLSASSYSFYAESGQSKDRLVLVSKPAKALALELGSKDWQVYASGKSLHLKKLSEKQEAGTFALYTLTGKEVQTFTTHQSISIDLSNLPKGIYFISNGSQTNKVLLTD